MSIISNIALITRFESNPLGYILMNIIIRHLINRKDTRDTKPELISHNISILNLIRVDII